MGSEALQPYAWSRSVVDVKLLDWIRVFCGLVFTDFRWSRTALCRSWYGVRSVVVYVRASHGGNILFRQGNPTHRLRTRHKLSAAHHNQCVVTSSCWSRRISSCSHGGGCNT